MLQESLRRVGPRRHRVALIAATAILAALPIVLAPTPALANHKVASAVGPDCHGPKFGTARVGDVVRFSVCVTLNGAPLPNFPMRAQIRANGTTTTRQIQTDQQGRASFTVEATRPGQIQVQVCDQDGCLYGNEEVTVQPHTTERPTQTPTPTPTTPPPPTETISTPTPTPSIPTTQERPPPPTTVTRERPPTCWWCWGIKLVFVINLLCVLFIFVCRREWFVWWLWWLLLIFIWIPFLLAGLIFFNPWWWWIPLYAWFPAMWGVAWFWARRQTWWGPWWWLWPLAWSGGLAFGLARWHPVWWFLLPIAWGPWVLFYLGARAFRAPWWRWWLLPLFGAWVFGIFWWVVWLTPFWAWVFPAAVVPIVFWWWWWKGTKSWSVWGPKLCFLLPWTWLPWFIWGDLLWDDWWWCWVVIAFFFLVEICVLFHFVRRQTWWVWWLWWLILIFMWIPLFLVGLIFFCPWWWWVALYAWFPAIWGVAWFWARRQTWWGPWWWLWPLAWTGVLAYGIAAWRCVWWFLLPVAWGPWVLFYLGARAWRANWWRWWLILPFGGWVFWIFAWAVWWTPVWWWVAAVAWVPVVLFWFWWRKEWTIALPKLCFLKGWLLLPPLVFAFTLYCADVPHPTTHEKTTYSTQSPEPVGVFLTNFGTAFRTGDSTFLLARLHPAEIQRYGLAQCANKVKTVRNQYVSFAFVSATGPAPYTWTTDGRSTVIPDTYTVTVQRTLNVPGVTTKIHLTLIDGLWHYFALSCGKPLP